MHGSRAANAQLLQALKLAVKPATQAAYVVCAPFPYLAQLATELQGTGIEWGAQDLSEHDSGAYTGEVSGAMLAEFGCRYVIVGHSERRSLHAETDAQVAAKMATALRHGLTPIVCVGESLAERESGQTAAVVSRQLDALMVQGTGALGASVLAYEPVWAIGTGRTATPEQAQDVHAHIRAVLRDATPAGTAEGIRILYGGSVKPGNIDELMACPDVDGALVGGASLNAEDFLRIVHFQE